MTDFNFKIPFKFEELTNINNDIDRYVVSQEYSLSEVNQFIDELLDKIKEDGPNFILHDFEKLYSSVKEYKSLDYRAKCQFWKSLVKSITFLEENLSQELRNSRSALICDASEKHKQCNVLKMHVFIFCSLIDLFEEEFCKKAQIGDKKSEAAKKKATSADNWEKEKEKAIDILLKILILPLNLIFNAQNSEEDLSNCVIRCCWKILENSQNTRNKPMTEKIFHILGNSVEKHRQSLGFCLKIIQLLQNKEAMVPLLAQLMESVVKHHNQRITISEIIREVERIDIKELSRDSSGPRAISHFLCEVAERCPEEMVPSIASLLSFLDQDSYMMRNATLSIIGEIVSKVLSKEGMNVKEKRLRDELLDKLELHIMDITSFTRGRAVQVWSKLCSERKIPLKRLDSLIEAIVARLMDKSTYVRKNAVQFLNCFLKVNPFAHELDVKVLNEAYNKEKTRLDKLLQAKDKLEENNDNAVDEADVLFQTWTKIESELRLSLKNLESNSNDTLSEAVNENGIEEEMGEQNEEDEDTSDSELIQDISLEIEKLRKELEEKHFDKVLKIYKFMEKNFKDDDIFKKIEEEENKKDDQKEVNGETDTEEAEKNEEVDENDQEMDNDQSSKSNLETEIDKIIRVCKNAFFERSSEKDQEDYNENLVRQEIEKLVSNNSRASTESNLDPSQLSLDTINASLEKQKVLVQFIRDLIKITEQIKISLPLVCSLLHSKNIQDVQEAIEFFVTAYEFGLKEDSAVGIRNMILLIFSSEPSKKASVIDAYKRLFINPPSYSNMNSYEKAKLVVKNLMELLKDATLEEVISIEKLLKELMASNDIDKIIIKVLWERYTLKLTDTTQEEVRLAIQLISMIASSNHNLIRDNIEVLIQFGLEDSALNDFALVRHTCSALCKAMSNQGRIVTNELPFRLTKTHMLFQRLANVLVNTLTKTSKEDWFPMSEEAIRAIFNLSENPDWVCEQILRKMIKYLTKNGKTTINEVLQATRSESSQLENSQVLSQISLNTDNTLTEQNVSKQNGIFDDIKIDSEVLARFISLVGTIALNLLVHLEINIFTEMKTRNAIREEKENKRSSTNRRVSMRRLTPKSPKADDDDELCLSGAVATEDAETEFIYNICNFELVEKFNKTENLLAHLSNMVIKIVSQPVEYSDSKLRAAASVTLSKFMCVSEKFCSKNLRLLFTVLQKSKECIIRSNAIIALGDLCLLFPNLLDPWTPLLYHSLCDPEVVVRSYTLKVLSRLILSDMIKVKEQISEIAKLMVDEEESISAFVRLFFTQLAKKQNAIYNILPDIISNLSDTNVGIDQENFRLIIKFLLELIDKDRHTIGLVEKLCHRYRGTINERQWLDISYCLSILNYSDRSIIKLIENFSCFADKLPINGVYESITSIISNAKKISGFKNETKQALDEFAQKVEKCRTKGTTEEIESEGECESEVQKEAATEAENVIQTTPKRTPESRYEARTTGRRTVRKVIENSKDTTENGVKDVDDEYEFSEEGSFIAESKTIKKRGNARKIRENKKKRVATLFSNDSEDDD